MKTIVNVPTKQSLIRETRDYLMIALGLILYGIGWTVFLLPNDITTGGVPGIASIVYFATGFLCSTLISVSTSSCYYSLSASWAGSSVSKQYSLYSP